MPRFAFYNADLLESAQLAQADGNDPSDALGAVSPNTQVPIRVVAVDLDDLHGMIVVDQSSPAAPVVVRGVGVVGDTGVPTAPVEPVISTPIDEHAAISNG